MQQGQTINPNELKLCTGRPAKQFRTEEIDFPIVKTTQLNYILRISRRIAKKIIANKPITFQSVSGTRTARIGKAVQLFLELKPVYNFSSCIMSTDGKKPYAKIMAMLNGNPANQKKSGKNFICYSSLRAHLKTLVQFGLAWYDHKQNFYLATYDALDKLYGIPTGGKYQRRHPRYKFYDYGNIKTLLIYIGEKENLEQQEYNFLNKAAEEQLLQEDFIARKEHQGDSLLVAEQSPITQKANRMGHVLWIDTKTSSGRDFFRKKLKAKRKKVQQQRPFYHEYYKERYYAEQKKQKNPAINPFITLGSAGTGRLFGKTKTTGWRYNRMLQEAGMIKMYQDIVTVGPWHYNNLNRIVPLLQIR